MGLLGRRGKFVDIWLAGIEWCIVRMSVEWFCRFKETSDMGYPTDDEEAECEQQRELEAERKDDESYPPENMSDGDDED
jgi:hypothetical protein